MKPLTFAERLKLIRKANLWIKLHLGIKLVDRIGRIGCYSCPHKNICLESLDWSSQKGFFYYFACFGFLWPKKRK